MPTQVDSLLARSVGAVRLSFIMSRKRPHSGDQPSPVDFILRNPSGPHPEAILSTTNIPVLNVAPSRSSSTTEGETSLDTILTSHDNKENKGPPNSRERKNRNQRKRYAICPNCHNNFLVVNERLHTISYKIEYYCSMYCYQVYTEDSEDEDESLEEILENWGRNRRQRRHMLQFDATLGYPGEGPWSENEILAKIKTESEVLCKTEIIEMCDDDYCVIIGHTHPKRKSGAELRLQEKDQKSGKAKKGAGKPGTHIVCLREITGYTCGRPHGHTSCQCEGSALQKEYQAYADYLYPQDDFFDDDEREIQPPQSKRKWVPRSSEEIKKEYATPPATQPEMQEEKKKITPKKKKKVKKKKSSKLRPDAQEFQPPTKVPTKVDIVDSGDDEIKETAEKFKFVLSSAIMESLNRKDSLTIFLGHFQSRKDPWNDIRLNSECPIIAEWRKLGGKITKEEYSHIYANSREAEKRVVPERKGEHEEPLDTKHSPPPTPAIATPQEMKAPSASAETKTFTSDSTSPAADNAPTESDFLSHKSKFCTNQSEDAFTLHEELMSVPKSSDDEGDSGHESFYDQKDDDEEDDEDEDEEEGPTEEQRYLEEKVLWCHGAVRTIYINTEHDSSLTPFAKVLRRETFFLKDYIDKPNPEFFPRIPAADRRNAGEFQEPGEFMEIKKRNPSLFARLLNRLGPRAAQGSDRTRREYGACMEYLNSGTINLLDKMGYDAFYTGRVYEQLAGTLIGCKKLNTPCHVMPNSDTVRTVIVSRVTEEMFKVTDSRQIPVSSYLAVNTELWGDTLNYVVNRLILMSARRNASLPPENKKIPEVLNGAWGALLKPLNRVPLGASLL